MHRVVDRCCAVVLTLAVSGCATDRPVNPSFPVTIEAAEGALADMIAQPKPLARPVVVIGGLFDPGLGVRGLVDHLKEVTSSEDRIIAVGLAGAWTFDTCAGRIVEALEREFPSSEPGQSVAVDVVACSMGGLAARHAAATPDDAPQTRKRLNIVRLFTISTPHRGAKMASRKSLDKRVACMHAESPFMQTLNGAATEYQLVPYVRLNDLIIGSDNAAPPGHTPWWLAPQPWSESHSGANDDPRIIADIARRLRGEPPFTIDPPAPLPQRSAPGHES